MIAKPRESQARPMLRPPRPRPTLYLQVLEDLGRGIGALAPQDAQRREVQRQQRELGGQVRPLNRPRKVVLGLKKSRSWLPVIYTLVCSLRDKLGGNRYPAIEKENNARNSQFTLLMYRENTGPLLNR